MSSITSNSNSIVPLFKVFMNNNHTELINVLNSGMITQGNKVEEFENQLKKYFNHQYILTLNSATSGLTLALRLLKDINGCTPFKIIEDSRGDTHNKIEQDEILTSPLTCTATNWPILNNNFKIKWIDVDKDTCNMNLDDLSKKINMNTRAILFVHWGSTPVDLDKLHSIRDEAELKFNIKIPIIQDCAHAFGAKYDNKFLGTHGDICVYSLQAIKHLTTGDGGLIFLPNSELYERAKLLRWFGLSREKRSGVGKDFRLEEDVKEWGYKFHMNDINATIGLSNLPFINDNLEKIRKNALYYSQNLNSSVLLKVPSKSESSYWIYTIKVPNKDGFIKYMNDNNIVVSSVHTRNDNHSCVSQFKTSLPILDELEKQFICIPVGWWLTQDDVVNITNLVNNWVDNFIEIIDLSIEYKDEYLNLIEILIGMKKYISDSDFLKFIEYNVKCNTKIILYKYQNKIVGTGKVCIEPKVYEDVAHIEDIVVDKNYRNKNIGSQMLNYLTNYSKINNCYKIVLNCKDDLIQFYEKNGYKPEGKQMVYRL